MKKANIGFAITGSFCTHKAILESIKTLVANGHNVYPIISAATMQTNTRFGTAQDFVAMLTTITNHPPINDIVGAEPTGPQNLFDAIILAPCTGNTLAKVALGINDSAVTMAIKAHVRNNKPVIIGLSTNDGLGLNLKNVATLLPSKNFFFVPFGQDDPVNKPKSLVADWKQIETTLLLALEGKQIQPILT